MWAGKRAVKAQVESPDLQRRLPGQHLLTRRKRLWWGHSKATPFFLLPAVPQIYLRRAWGAGVIIFPVPRVTPVWSQPTTVMSLFWTDVFEVGVELSSGTCDVICQGLIGKLSAQEKQGEVSSLTLDIAPGGNEAGTGRVIWWPQEGPARGQSQCIDDELWKMILTADFV